MGIFEKFKIGFKKSASTFTSGLRDIIVKKEIDDKTLDQVEDYLIKSDVGVDAASEIKEIISSEKIDPKKETINEVNLILKNYIIKLMRPLENNNFFNKNDKLKIILISGVNGVGKTTTIGKIGKILKSNENKILFSFDFRILPIFPMVVVLPTPFTPEISIILSLSFLLKKLLFSNGFINFII